MQASSCFSSHFRWMTITIIVAILLSMIYACVAPFAAVAAFSALVLPRLWALLMVGVFWMANQITGYALLNYPIDFLSFGWGAALGGSALVALFAAQSVIKIFQRKSMPAWALVPLTFLTALGMQQLTVWLASFPLGAGPEAFSMTTLFDIAQTNGWLFLSLLIVQYLGELSRMTASIRPEFISA
jgi:hypothetical protein